MFEYKTGDLLAEDAEAHVNAVNCVGVMDGGIALHFKNAYPDNFNAYENACKLGEVRPGRMFVFETGNSTSPRYIVNFPTKNHWRDPSRMEDIDAGLNDLKEVVRNKGIKSIAMPALGCGFGGLDWDDVRPRIEEAFSGFKDLNVIIFQPKESQG